MRNKNPNKDPLSCTKVDKYVVSYLGLKPDSTCYIVFIYCSKPTYTAVINIRYFQKKIIVSRIEDSGQKYLGRRRPPPNWLRAMK